MKFTRDGLVWLIGMGASTVVGLGSYFGVLGDLLVEAGLDPVSAKRWQARVQIVSLLVGVTSGKLSMSPLSLSPKNEMAVNKETASQTVNPVTNTPLEKK